MDSAEEITRPPAALPSQPLTLASLFARRGPYVGTVLAHVVALGLTLATLKLAADRFDATGFGEFLVSRRAVTMLTFPLLLGLGIGLPRYVAMAGSSGAEPSRSGSYLLAALSITIVVVPSFLVLAVTFQRELAYLFFGAASRAALILPTTLVVVGLYLYTIMYAHFLGRFTVLPANLLLIVNVGLIPAIAVLLSGDAASALVLLGAATTVTSLIGILAALRTIAGAPMGPTAIKAAARELLRFGLPRVPGEFALYGLFAIPTFVVAHRFDIEQAGYFSFGLSLVQLIGTPFGAVNLVLLPTVSWFVARAAWRRISDFMTRFVIGTAVTAALAVAVAEFLFSSPARTLLGPALAQAADASRVLLVSAVPYVAYVVVRGALDAISTWPYNSVNLIGSVALVSVLLMAWSTYDLAQLAVLLGLLALGISTVFAFARSLRQAAVTVSI